MVTSSIKPSRLFRIACQVMFYSLLTFFIAWRAGYTELTPNTLLSAVTPITSEGYWFASAYFLLYLTIPLLNRAIRGITDRRSYSRILIIMLIVTSVWPTVFYWSDPMLVNGGYSYVWFIVLYFLAAYIRLYGLSVKRRLSCRLRVLPPPIFRRGSAQRLLSTMLWTIRCPSRS